MKGSLTMLAAFIFGFSEANGSWNTACMLRRCWWSAATARVVSSTPSSRTLPPLGSTRRRIALPAVDLPLPLSPTRPSVSPWPICSEIAVDRAQRGAAAE